MLRRLTITGGAIALATGAGGFLLSPAHASSTTCETVDAIVCISTFNDAAYPGIYDFGGQVIAYSQPTGLIGAEVSCGDYNDPQPHYVASVVAGGQDVNEAVPVDDHGACRALS